MIARIYRPARSAMQSGKANSSQWLLEFVAARPKTLDPLMGWVSGSDTSQQVRLKFETAELAVAYAVREGIPYEVQDVPPDQMVRKAYSDNFRWGRPTNWTH